MAKSLGPKACKERLERYRPDDGGGTIWSLGFLGNPLNGTAASDFLLATGAGTINGLGGDDLILGDIYEFLPITPGNSSFGSAVDLDNHPSIWSIKENPVFAADSIPHATVYVLGEAGTQEYFKIVIGAGQTLTIDIDGGGGTLGSDADTDTNVVLYAASDLVNPVASNNDSPITAGGYGSASTLDSFLVFTNTGPAATYIIRILEFLGNFVFEADDEFLLNVSLTGHSVVAGSAQDGDRVEAGHGNDHLFGAGGDDTLFGMGGIDLMVGGTGNDGYIVEEAGDVVVEVAGEGADVVLAETSYALTADASVERLQTSNEVGTTPIDLTGSSIGNTISGNAGVNILRGEGGNDTLNGFGGNDFLVGGAGTDIMAGGTGDDTYYVDETSDAISEFAGQGFDRLATIITLALAADADIERIDVEALTSTNAIDLTGSGIANVIYGNDGVNILRGEAGNDELRGFGGNDFLVGGTGTDLMVGGLGDDTFYVDDASDAIGEIAGEGNDRIAASVSFVLSNGASVELLEAVNLLATTAFDLTGSDSSNKITGNNGVNILRGEGGADILSSAGGDDFLVGGSGVDSMTGGAGDDTYYVDDLADIVLEIAGEGTGDRVAASIHYALSANADIERLEADPQAGTVALNLFGSSIANLITGNDGQNFLDGRGGSDSLTGLGGADSFAFSTALGAGNVDIVNGFVSGSDKLVLYAAVFNGIAMGALSAGAFVTGASAQDADNRIVYNSATGALFYDADGNGAGAAVQFATLAGMPVLAASDFQVI